MDDCITDATKCPDFQKMLTAIEPIIDCKTLEKAQARQKGARRKKPIGTQGHSVFSGLLKCAECGSNLNFHFTQAVIGCLSKAVGNGRIRKQRELDLLFDRPYGDNVTGKIGDA